MASGYMLGGPNSSAAAVDAPNEALTVEIIGVAAFGRDGNADVILSDVDVKNQAAFFRRLKRSVRKGAGSTQGVEPVTRSAIRAPAPGPIPKPWPEKPVAR